MPKATSTNGDSSSTPQTSFSSISSPQSSASPLASSSKNTNPIDWSSLTTFDPSVLNLLDDSVPQPTATEGAMQMDFGFGDSTGLASNAPYTSIASNPMFMSFASTFEAGNDASSPTPSTSGASNFSQMNFDMNNLSTWSTPSNSQDTILDDLFSGYLSSTGQMDMSMLAQSPASSLSPVTHHISPAVTNNSNNLNNARSPVASSSSSASSPSVLGSSLVFTTPRDSPASSTSESNSRHGEDTCPRTRKELEKRIASEGASPFAPPVNVRKSSDAVLGTMIACSGSSFPTTAKSDKNIEVLSAWRSIRADPKFKVGLLLLLLATLINV